MNIKIKLFLLHIVIKFTAHLIKSCLKKCLVTKYMKYIPSRLRLYWSLFRRLMVINNLASVRHNRTSLIVHSKDLILLYSIVRGAALFGKLIVKRTAQRLTIRPLNLPLTSFTLSTLLLFHPNVSIYADCATTQLPRASVVWFWIEYKAEAHRVRTCVSVCVIRVRVSHMNYVLFCGEQRALQLECKHSRISIASI